MTIDYALPAGLVKPPWDASHFQVQRNGTRGYADTLPPCDLIPDPHTDPVPGFSSLKPSKPFRKSVMVGDRKYTVPLDWYRAGEWVFGHDSQTPLHEINRADFYYSVHVQRDRDFARGHAIHAAAEAALIGQGVLNVNPDAEPYIPHLLEWIERNVTDVHATEAVVFGDGYGGTGDAWLNIRGVSCYVDFKSRGVDSAHGVYEEELCQVGAYTSARYCILPSDDRERAVRAPLPAATYGLILSIRPDGISEYWADVAGCQEAFKCMHFAYRATSESGKVARAAKVKDPTSTIETAKRKTKPTPTVARTPPDEGPQVDVTDLRNDYMALDDAGRTWIGELQEQAVKAGVSFHLKDSYTQRRAAITRGLVTLAKAEADDDDATRALVRFATTDDACEWPVTPVGAAVGSMNAGQATTFAAACNLFVGGVGVSLEHDQHGPKVVGV